MGPVRVVGAACTPADNRYPSPYNEGWKNLHGAVRRGLVSKQAPVLSLSVDTTSPR